MAKSPQSFAKRQRERLKQEKQAAKRSQREERKREREEAGDPEHDEAELYEQFRLLSEQHAAGAITTEDFEARREEIFVKLGLAEAPDDGDHDDETDDDEDEADAV
ncbi:MAG: hypothetical protein ACR2QE_06810 [Acidimicrobiales bacterium]